MKKLLLSLAVTLLTLPALAQEETTEQQPIFYGTPSNMVLTIQAMDAATEYGNEPAEVNYFLQPVSEGSVKYSSQDFDIRLKGYTDPVKGKTAKYIYSIKYYKYGYGQDAPEGENNNPIGNTDNSYTVFIGEDDADITLGICAVWPDGKNYVEWIHNFSNVVATDANVYGYLYISGNKLPRTYTYINKFAGETGVIDGSNFNKYYTKTNTTAANISTSFLKGDSQTSLVYLSDNTFNTDKEDGVYKAAIDYATGELKLTPVTEKFELYIDGFTTVVTPFDFELTDGVNAYTLTYDAEGEYLKANQIEGTTVKAYTPVVLAASEVGEYTFDITAAPAPFKPTLVDSQAKKGTLADTHMEGNVLVGVNHPHWLDVYNGNNEVNNRYVLSGSEFIINKALDTKKQYDNPITPQYTCYVELPSDLGNAPKSLTIVFPEEEEPIEPAEKVLYIHFTDNEGNYSSTHNQTLTWSEEDKIYSNERVEMPSLLDSSDDKVFFVLSDCNTEISLLSTATDWADYGTVYHATNESNGVAVLQGEEEVKPFEADPEYVHEIQLKLGEDNVPVSMSIVNTNIPTGVTCVEAELNNGVTYNIFGQKVDESYKGIVIRNGKKFIQR